MSAARKRKTTSKALRLKSSGLIIKFLQHKLTTMQIAGCAINSNKPSVDKMPEYMSAVGIWENAALEI